MSVSDKYFFGLFACFDCFDAPQQRSKQTAATFFGGKRPAVANISGSWLSHEGQRHRIVRQVDAACPIIRMR